MSRIKIMVIIFLFIALLLVISRSFHIFNYINYVKISNNEPNHYSEEQLDLLHKIKAEALKLKIEPINAKVDSIWKAIPGYNGKEVDVEKTFKLAIQSQSKGEISYIFKEVSPKIHLDQLGPQPIFKGNALKPMVSLMINVAWGNEFLPTILKILEKENVHATFFLDGSWLKRNIDLAKNIAKHGHELSNHAYSHKNMSQLNNESAAEEIIKTENLLKQLGVNNTLFAPPSGDFDQETVIIANNLHLKTILWTIDTLDWKKPRPEWIIQKIASQLEPGAMILMHPTSSSSLALEAMIQEIKRRGLVLGTVSELISPQRVPQVETTLNFW